MPRNVAVAIGVGNPTNFGDTLPGAPEGAKDFIAWAKEQPDTEVKLFTDDAGQEVRRSAVFEYLGTLQNAGVSRLLLYFSGHGVSTTANQDFWIFSRAVADPIDLIDVRATRDNLRAFSRIPHVAVFADACRSPAGTDIIQNTIGAGPIFPSSNSGEVSVGTKLDMFYATKSWQVALEAVLDATEADADADAEPEADPKELKESLNESMVGAHGYFTDLLLAALRGEKRDALAIDSAGNTVVSASKLEVLLMKELPSITGEHVAIPQVPDSRPTSQGLALAYVGPAETARLTYEAQLPNGQLAAGASIKLLRIIDKLNMPTLASSDTGVVSREVPEGHVYGAEATLAGFVQSPDMPRPLVYLPGDTGDPVPVPLVPLARGPRGVSLKAGRRGPPAALTDSYAIDSAGAPHHTVPTAGAFTVVTEDLLTGRTHSELRILDAGERAAPSQPLRADPVVEGAIDKDVDGIEASRVLRDHFETTMGLSIVGAEVLGARAGHAIDVLDEGEVSGHKIRPIRGHVPGSAIVQLAGERFACLAMLPGFLGVVNVRSTGTRSLSYTPTTNSDFYAGEEDPGMIRVRAMAEAAVRSGRLELITDRARPFADNIRVYKHADPVLGVLAAYAYYQAGDIDAIREMSSFFLSANGFAPFDLMMLAADDTQARDRIVPGFPMLTEGWRYLGPDDAMHPALAAARRNLAPSLWATVNGPEGAALAEAVERGEIQ